MCGYKTDEWEEDYNFKKDDNIKSEENDYKYIEEIDFETFKSIDGFIKS